MQRTFDLLREAEERASEEAIFRNNAEALSSVLELVRQHQVSSEGKAVGSTLCAHLFKERVVRVAETLCSALGMVRQHLASLEENEWGHGLHSSVQGEGCSISFEEAGVWGRGALAREGHEEREHIR